MARPTKEKAHLFEKRQELVWALEFQGYAGSEIAVIFNVGESVICLIIKKKPRGWKPKWFKVEK